MTALLILFRIAATLIWFSVAAFCSGSIVRPLIGRRLQHDRAFGVLFFLAVMMIGYSARSVVFPRDYQPGADLSSALGLQILSIMIAVGAIRERGYWAGWRW